MADELYSILTKFHREVVVPDIQRIVGDAVAPLDARLESVESRVESVDSRVSSVESNLKSFRNETLSHFDAMYKRFDRLESEYHALSAAVKRIEERLDRTALGSELLELKA